MFAGILLLIDWPVLTGLAFRVVFIGFRLAIGSTLLLVNSVLLLATGWIFFTILVVGSLQKKSGTFSGTL